MAMQLSGSLNLTGSLNVSSSVNLSGSVVINQITYPTLTFGDGQYGVEVPTLGVNNTLTMEIPRTIYEYVKNDSGVTLLKGTPVHSTGTVGFNTLVIAASASNATTMPATFILAQDLDDEEEGLGIAIGAIQGVDTTGLIAGDPVWVGADGGWTQTKPTGSNLIQNLGIVTKVGSNGGGVVLGAGRSNDVPNIQQGYFWVGNSGSVATAFPTSSFELSGRGVVSSSNQLPQIDGLQAYTASLKGAAIVSSSQQITELTQIGPIEAYTASLKGAIEVSGQNVNVLGMITAQQFNVTYVSSSIMYQSGSNKFGNSGDDKHEFTGSVKISGSFEVQGTNTSATVGDLLVDSINKYVYVGRQSVTSGDNTTLVLRDRTGTARATLPAGGSIDTIFTTNASNFKITNYSGTNLLNVSNVGNVTASGTFTVGGQTQIGTTTTDTSLGSNTKLKVVGDGSVNAGASQGSLFVAAGNDGGDTGLPINMGTAGATALLLASINTSTGTSTNSATYIVRFYFDGNNAPTTTYLGGSSDFVTFGVTPSNTLAVSGSSSGNKSYAWFINKFGA